MPAPEDAGVSQATQPSAIEWLRLLSAKQLSARELTQHYIERVERVNPVLNAVVAFDPDRALAEADRLTRRAPGVMTGRCWACPLRSRMSSMLRAIAPAVARTRG